MDNTSVGAEFPTESIETVIIVSIASGTGLIILVVLNLFVCGIVLTLCRSPKSYEFHSESPDPAIARESQSKDEYPATPLYTTVIPLDFSAAPLNTHPSDTGQHLAVINLESYRVPSTDNIYASISESRNQTPNPELGVQQSPTANPVHAHSCTELNDGSHSVEDEPRLREGEDDWAPDLTLTQDLDNDPVLI